MGIIPINMFATIIMFRMPSKTPTSVVNQCCKKLYGQDTSSHKGRYRYHRHGLLDDIPHRRIIRQVIIVRNSDVKKVVDFLNEYHAEIHLRKVELTKEDISALALNQPTK